MSTQFKNRLRKFAGVEMDFDDLPTTIKRFVRQVGDPEYAWDGLRDYVVQVEPKSPSHGPFRFTREEMKLWSANPSFKWVEDMGNGSLSFGFSR